MPREVYIGSHTVGRVSFGGVRIPVIAGDAGVAGGGDMVRAAPVASRSGEELARLRASARVPLLVELDAVADAARVTPYADAVIIDAAGAPAGVQPDAGEALGAANLPAVPALPRAPAIVRRRSPVTLDAWIGLAQRCAAAGATDVVLWEGGGSSAPDLAMLGGVRERTDAAIIVDVAAAPELAGAAVAAGADGIAVAHDADASEVARIVELATTLAPFGGRGQPADLGATRQAIDQVDACLADLLERRASLAGLVQKLKPVGGFAGRDLERERALVAAMARRAPRLGVARMRRIMEVVIEAGLELAESEDSGTSRSVSDRDVSQAR